MSGLATLRPAAVLALALLAPSVLCPPPAHAEPDEAALGQALGYPVARTRAELFESTHRVGTWSAVDQVPGVRVRAVARGDTVQALPPAANPPAITYTFRGATRSVDDYLERRRVTGLLVLKDGEVVLERYRYGRTPESRFLSFSMAKSVTALLVGIALQRGAIASLDDRAEVYAKELQGAPYGETTLRQLLRMSSGLVFSERYDGRDDVARLAYAANTGRPDVVSVLRSIAARHAPAGERFAYASAETEVLGRVLAGATGRTLADLTADWLWKPIGAEHEAFWVTGHDGQERASGYFNATLRDWGRLGLLLARDGRVGEQAVVPRDYLLEATALDRQPEAFRPGRVSPGFGYGYQFWLLPLRERTFALRGVFGQTLYVQPASGIVMVQTAVYAQPAVAADPDPHAERGALWLGVLRALGGAAD